MQASFASGKKPHGGYLYSVVGIANGTGGGWSNVESLVLLEAVSQKAVDGTVVIVRIRVEGLEKETVHAFDIRLR